MQIGFSPRLPRFSHLAAGRCFLMVLCLAMLGACCPCNWFPPDAAGESRAPIIAPSRPESPEQLKAALGEAIQKVQKDAAPTTPWDTLFPPKAKVLDVQVAATFKEASPGAARTTSTLISINFSAGMAERSWTPESRAELERWLHGALEARIPRASQFKLSIAGADFEDYLTSPEAILRRQSERSISAPPPVHPVVERADYPGPPAIHGLYGRHLAIAASHGWIYNDSSDSWEWQRCRLFTTIEDLYTMSYVNPFLLPMLENAGAVVFSERERDFQTAEVIVDNDGAGSDAQTSPSQFIAEGRWAAGTAQGWRGGVPGPLAEDAEPFKLGTTLEAAAGPQNAPISTSAVFIPHIPKDGRYAVYLSWPAGAENSPSVPVTVRHAGGEAQFRVNQQVAGSTWVFLDFFEFKAGRRPASGAVLIQANGAEPSEAAQRSVHPTKVRADAVRFGGGMGNIAPNGRVSHHPRYAEGARYFAQYSGAPADLVFHPALEGANSGRDYDRDVLTRPEWINYINGAPNGPNKDRSNPGLGVPIDAALAWHTDAGVSQDGLIGTLSIYRLQDQTKSARFPDGRSRRLNRDLAAMIQDEISRSARSLYTSTWRRRQLMDGNYGEVRRPNVPTALLELLSHQNFNDMKYGTDPRFKRDIARAIYKAMLRFVAASNGFEPVVAPLAPIRFSARQTATGRASLEWAPQEDPIEPSATPDGYIVYQSLDGKAFDSGRWTREPRWLTPEPLAPGRTFYFRVAAANTGGQSFPTSVAAVRRGASPDRIALLVDGFDRICGPAVIENGDVRGFDRARDPGVGFHYNFGLVGDQYDFFNKSEFLTNAQPGWGASRRDFEDKLERGNSFDHVIAHARMFEAAEWGFDSMTADAWPGAANSASPSLGAETGALPLNGLGRADCLPAALEYPLVDWIAGLQRSTPPPAGMEGVGKPDRMKIEFEAIPAAARKRLEAHLQHGGKLILSGAYVGEDLLRGPLSNEESRRFARQTLGIAGAKSFAPRSHSVSAQVPGAPFDNLPSFRFGNDLEASTYPVPIAEWLKPSPGQTRMALKYGDAGLRSSALRTEYEANADEENDGEAAGAAKEVMEAKKDNDSSGISAQRAEEPKDSQAPCAALIGSQAAVFGFPLETVLPEKIRDDLLKSALRSLALPCPAEPPAENKRK